MLRPECKQGDRESDLLITALINSDGYKAQMQKGEDTVVQAGEGPIFPFAGS